MARVPPSGIASLAFRARFMSTCPICPGSTSTRPRSGSSRVPSSMSSPIRRSRISRVSMTTAFRSTTCARSTWRREKARSWRVRSAARRAAVRICSSRGRFSSPAWSFRRRSSAWPSTTPRMLLKSWATPPARRPTASSFCDWRSCSRVSRRVCSAATRPVTSREIPSTATTRPSESRTATLWISVQTIDPSSRTQRMREGCIAESSPRNVASITCRSPGWMRRGSRPGSARNSSGE